MIGWCMGWAILLVSAGATPGGCVEIRTSSSQNPVSREGTTSFFFFFGCSCLGFCRVLFVVVVTFVFFCCGCCRGRGVCLLLGFYVFFPFVVWLVLGFFRCYWFLLLFCCFLVRGPWLSPWHTHTHTHTHTCLCPYILSVCGVREFVCVSVHASYLCLCWKLTKSYWKTEFPMILINSYQKNNLFTKKMYSNFHLVS